MANRTVKVTIQADTAGAVASVRTFRGAMADMGKELDVLQRKHADRFNRVASTTGKIGIGLAVAFGAVVKSTMDFDKQMSAVVAVSDQGAKSLGALRGAAIQAGKDTAYTATQAAQAEEELAKAGISTADILGGGLKGALNLAAAGSLDLANAATISAQAMVEFGLKGTDVGHIADVLTSGANASTSSVEDLGLSLGQVGGVAHQTGLSLEDTVGTLARFAQGGMNGEEAGTTLKQMLLQLQAPSGQAADLMKQLGISIYDAQGHFIGITAVAQNLKDKLGGLNEAQRNAALGTLFGSRAVRGATILYQEGADGLQGWIDKSNVAGQAATTAGTKLDNLSGDLHKLIGSLQAVAIESGGGATSGLRFLAQGAEKTVNAFSDIPKPVQSTLTALAGISAVSLLATSGLLKVKSTVSQAMDALRSAGPTATKFADTLGRVGSVAGTLTVVGVAAFAGFEAFKALGDWIASKSAPVAHDIDKMTVSLQSFARTGVATGEMASAFGSDLRGLERNVQEFEKYQKDLAAAPAQIRAAVLSGQGALGPAGADIKRLTEESKQARQNLGDLDKTLASMASNGGAVQAKIAFNKLAMSLLEQGVSIAQVRAMFPQYEAAAKAAATANSSLALGFGDVAANAQTMTKGLQDAIDHGETLDSVFKQLNGAAEDLARANIDVKQKLADLSAQFKKGKDAINDNTQAGRDNLSLVLDTIDAAEKAAQAEYNKTQNVADATKVYNDYIAQLRRELLALGLSKDAVDQLLAAYAKMPPTVSTTFVTPGLDPATTKILSYKQTIDELNGRIIRTYIVQDTVTGQTTKIVKPGQQFNRWGGVYDATGRVHAQGGALRDAALYSAVSSGARYAFAEPATGGEAFIPRNGDMARSRGIADYVVSRWLGGSTSFGNGAGSSDNSVNLHVHAIKANLDAAELQQWQANAEARHRVGRRR